MGWYNYYTLLEKYEGDLSKATQKELQYAARCNPNDPPTARRIAEEHYRNDQNYKKAMKP
jgi:hypothetical protein